MKTKEYFVLDLSKGINILDQGSGIFVKDLKAGDVVKIRTNNTYEFLFLDSEGNAIVTSNGPYITEPTLKKVFGATLGGSMIRIDWILLDYRLEIEGLFITRVRELYLNGKKFMPPQKVIH